MSIMQQGDKPYWISCVFPNDDDNLPDGTTVEELSKIMLQGSPAPYAIGFNCTKVHKVSSLVQKFEDAAQKHGFDLPRLVIYPDGARGKVYDTKLQQWIGSDDEQSPWDQQVYDIVKEVQARNHWKGIIVGGCCKTAPKHIKKLKERLEELR